MGRKWTFI